MELLTHGGEHPEIGDGGWLMMTTATNPPLRSPERTPDQPSQEVLGLGGESLIFFSDETFSLIFFLRETEYMELELRLVEHQGAHETGGCAQGRRAWPPPSWTGCGPPGLDYFASIFYIFQKLSPWIFRSFRELLFSTHKTTSWQFC